LKNDLIACDAKSPVLEREPRPQEDLTGRDRLVSNVIFSWAGHLVFIVAGFIMPRMIDRRLGQDILGVWDFAWSLVSYFELVQAGIGSSVSRYVARYRAAANMADVNRIVSSATFILGIGGVIIMGLTVAASLLLPRLFGHRLGENVVNGQWVVLFLGASVCVRVSLSAFNGVLTGCHSWRLHNINTSGWYALTVGGMIVALHLGGGLPALAGITLVGEMLSGVRRVVLARRVCGALRLRRCDIQWPTMRELLVFGGKTLVPSISNLLLNQTASILIVYYLGSAALAVYSRPRSLVYHVSTLVQKMAVTLTPTTSSLQSVGDHEGIQSLLITAVRYSFHLALPMIHVVVVFGGPILQLWMGSNYANGLIPAILGVGYLASIVQMPAMTVLTGLNAHGRVGLAQVIASVCSAGLTVLLLGCMKWGLVGAAIATAIPLTVANTVYLPVQVCRSIKLSMVRYLMVAVGAPIVHTLPFLACLLATRMLLPTRSILALLIGGGAGTAVLVPIYWRYALSASVRERLMAMVLPTWSRTRTPRS
jgi:O-antigen/teichoic acid export membrane protein